MSDEPATDGEYRESVHDGLIELGFTPLSGGKIMAWVDYTPDGDTESVLRRTVPRAVFTEPTPKGKFLNDAESALTAYETINETAARNELREVLDELGQQGREQQVEMMDPELRPLIENTEFPVRIYADGDETTFEVDTTFKGKRGTQSPIR